jgi:hypothetical protein
MNMTPMTPFMNRFPKLAASETRSVTVTDRDDLPNGEYGFIEFYCNEPQCDCRRVLVVVLRPETGWKFWAAINYGWESMEFYQRWAGAPAWDRYHWKGPFLDPMSEQTAYAPALLKLFKFILQSPGYAERLKKHYQLFRAAVDEEYVKRNPTLQFPEVQRRAR